jgi:hypothetical protein
MTKPSFSWRRYGLLHSFFILSLIGLTLLAQNPSLSEWWTIHIARTYQSIFGPMMNLLPLSMMELFWMSYGVFVIMQLIRSMRLALKAKWLDAGSHVVKITATLLIITNVYMATAGIAYQRLPVAIPQFNGTVTPVDYVDVIDHYRDMFNAVSDVLTFENGKVKNPYSIKELSVIIEEAFVVLDSNYFTAFTPHAKPMLSAFLFREFHITGVHFAPTTEAMINQLIPPAHLPFTIAHEIAHAKGVMREDDANLVAVYVCLMSDNPFLRYSALYHTFYALLNLSRFIGDDQAYGRYYQSLSPSIKEDYHQTRQFWLEYDLLNDLARWVNDLYLKIFGNPEGVDSYTDEGTIGETVDEDNNIIEYIIEYSPYQKLFFYHYFNLVS